MANARLWHLIQQLRQVTSAQGEAKGLWDDQVGSHIRGRYLRPHEQSATSQIEGLSAHDSGLERVNAAVRNAQLHYEESRLAGELVVREMHEAQYAVSVTHDFIRRGLTNEGRAAQLQEHAVAAAQQANALGDGAPGERGQTRVAVTYSPLARRVPTQATVPAAVWPIVESRKLGNIVENLYKGTKNPDRVGDGTTADAIRFEIATGELTHGRPHQAKGLESERGLSNFLRRNPDASDHDRQVAQQLLDDLSSARGGS